MRDLTPPIRLHVLPGGKLPKRQTEGAIGYDVYLRAIVSPFVMDKHNHKLRKTLVDFRRLTPQDKTREVKEAMKHVVRRTTGNAYRLEPGESVLVGIGFVTEMPYPLFYWVAPRSGLAAKWKIQVTNAPGTVDPDYRGEAGVLVLNHSDRPFHLERNMRIAQIIFNWAVIPQIAHVHDYSSLGKSKRGAGGFGSTGITDKKKARQ